MQVKGKEYQEELRKMKQDQEDFQVFMKQNYDYTVSEKQQIKKMEVLIIFKFFFRNFEK